MALTLVLNGQTRSFDGLSEASSLEDLIGVLALKGDRVAVEHNGQIAARAGWGETALRNGDRLEVVHFVGGGSFRRSCLLQQVLEPPRFNA